MDKEVFLDKVQVAMGADFDVNIVEGSMVIKPAEAGIALFSHIDISEQNAATTQKYVETLEDLLEHVREDNSDLRNLLEIYLEQVEDKDLQEQIIKLLYPLSAINDEGEEVKFEGEER